MKNRPPADLDTFFYFYTTSTYGIYLELYTESLIPIFYQISIFQIILLASPRGGR